MMARSRSRSKAAFSGQRSAFSLFSAERDALVQRWRPATPRRAENPPGAPRAIGNHTDHSRVFVCRAATTAGTRFTVVEHRVVGGVVRVHGRHQVVCARAAAEIEVAVEIAAAGWDHGYST